MVQCNDITHIEVQPTYYFTSDDWYRLPEAEKIRIIEAQSRHKRSHGNDGGTVISEIKTGGNSKVQDNIRRIQHIISTIEYNTDNQ